MDNSEHTHRLSFPESIASILISLLVLFVFFIMSRNMSLADFLGVVVLAFVMLPLAFGLLARPFVTKIVVKPYGLEYHTTIYVMGAEWKHLVSVDHFKNTTAGKSLVVVPREGRLKFRAWAKPLRRFLKHDPKDVRILVSQFRASNGHTFETDVLVNVSQHGKLSTELEPL